MLGVMICSKNELGFIRYLSDLILQIVFDDWWDSMNVHPKRLIAWNISRHAPLWQLYLHWAIE
jgi:hypothetical protein